MNMVDLRFLIDQLTNSMEFFEDENEFAEHISSQTDFDEELLKQVYNDYWDLDAGVRMRNNDREWTTWLDSEGLLEHRRKLTKQTLRKIIKEEYTKLINEQGFWHSDEAKDADEYYHGIVMGDMVGKEQGDLVVTQKGDIFKFVHGSKDTTKEPYLKLIKRIKVPKFNVDDNAEFAGKTWQPLPNATIYRLKNGKYYWEY